MMRAACLDVPVRPKVVVAFRGELHRLDCDCELRETAPVSDGDDASRPGDVRTVQPSVA
jgi:hypothetical protein